MSKSSETLKKELEKLENEMFMLQMCDHWSMSDYDLSNKLHKEIKEKKKELDDAIMAEMKSYGIGGI